MTGYGRRRTEDRKQKTAASVPGRPLSVFLFGLCLCILALRVTYTESPTAQTASMAGGLSDTVYSLTLSGLLGFAFVVWLVRDVLSGRLAYRFTGIEIGLGLFLLACIISTAVASDKRLAIVQFVILLGPLLAALLLVQILDSAFKVRLALIVVGALAVVSAYQSAEQMFVSNQITIEQYEKAPETLLEPLGIEPGSFQQFLLEHRLYSRGIRGFFTTSNSAASFGLMASFAALALLLEQVRSGPRARQLSRDVLCRAAGTCLVVAALLLTQSKGGILGFLLAGILFALLLSAGRWLVAHRRLTMTVLLPLALVLAVAVGYVAISYGLEHGRLPGGNSMLVRWQYWVASAQMFRDHPLAGIGPGNFAQNYTRFKPPAAPESVADPHCLPLSLLTQYGPLGLAGFLVMVLGPFVRSVRSQPMDGEPVERHQAASIKRPTLALLAAACGVLLLLRPILIPMPPADDPTLIIYEVVALYAAPAAAFLIGFLLLAAPLIAPSAGRAQSQNTIIAVAMGCAVFGVMVHNAIDFAIFEPAVWTTFWLLIACFVATQGQGPPHRSLLLATSVRCKAVAVVLALVLVTAFWHFVWRPSYEAASHIQRAQQAAAMGRFDRAHALLDAAFEADPLSPASLSLSGRLYIQQYEQSVPKKPALLEQAAQYLRQAVKVSPADYKDYEKLGVVYSLLGRHEEAFGWFTRAIEHYPGSGRLWFGRAQIAEQIGKRDVVLTDYCRAVEIEDAYRQQFRRMYPQREVVSRLGEASYELARKRIAELSI